MKDNSGQSGEPPFDLTCQQVVHALIEKYDWALLPEAELVELVLAIAPAEATLAQLEKLTKKQYTVVMYEACRQTSDSIQRRRAYQELAGFLYRAAYNRWPDLAKEVADRGLMLVYQQLDRCYSPTTFLAFAFNKLRQAFTEELRAREKLDISLEEIEWDTFEDVSPAPFAESEQQRILIEAIQRLRNQRQQKTILWKYFEGISDEEIAARLGITAGYVRKLRFDGLAQLRNDPQLRNYHFGP
jgi:RNA polymerase sigma factor (sigma-70 family)